MAGELKHRWFRDALGVLYQVDCCLIAEQNGEDCDRVCDVCETAVGNDHPVAYEVINGEPSSVGVSFHENCLNENMKDVTRTDYRRD